MAKARPNLRGAVGHIGGNLVDDLNALGRIEFSDTTISRLNALDPGLGEALKKDIERSHRPNTGTKLISEINQRFVRVSTRQDAQAGLRGTVGVAKQVGKIVGGKRADAIKLDGDTIGGVANAISNDQVPNWGQVKSLFTCAHFAGHVSGFEGWFEDCVGQKKAAAVEPGATTGIVHAMWGYTYEIPNFTDTVVRDPGALEADSGGYWQMIVPVTTTLDRVSFWTPTGSTPASSGDVYFALYDINTSNSSWERVAVSDPLPVTTGVPFATRRHTLALDSRVTIDPGIYAVAYIAPCFDILCILGNDPIFRMVNELWNDDGGPTTDPGPNRYGGIFLDGGTTMPDTLNLINATSHNALFSTWIPMSYWDDSETFSETGGAVIE
jgi:hypothetical protein